ncbi:cell wall binding protein [[Clostridium] sordellii]|uniref:Cell wall binding protein n=1 Tax=Paraclostridium sordellii TaxID=1505 RepID=A0A0C7R2C0_PARSO|nr:hypothetical protein [Paeniclostridium sordellii]CEQ03000.1 cell wall binding protein [[Clostridium] sordellii] [Paeniclostridium sordellii]
MIEKFNSMSKGKKIIVGIIGVMFFPILLILIGIDLLIDGIKNKDKGRITGGSFIIIVLIIVMINISNDQSNSNQEVEQVSEETKNTFELSDGMYKVGEDIDAGEYLLVGDGPYAYYQVSNDSTGDAESIISNDNFSTNRYLTVSDGQYLQTKGCKIVKPSEIVLNMDEANTLKDGMYKVGVDIPAGEYKVTSNEATGYVEVTNSSNGNINEIVSNDNFEGEKYVTVSEGQYLKLANNTELIK